MASFKTIFLILKGQHTGPLSIFLTVLCLSSISYSIRCSDVYTGQIKIERLDAYRGDVTEFGAIFLVTQGARKTVYKATEGSKLEKESLELGNFLVEATQSKLIRFEVPSVLTEVPAVLKGKLSLNGSIDVILKSEYIENKPDYNPENPKSEFEAAKTYHTEAMRIYNWVKEKSPVFRGYPVRARIDDGLPELYEGGKEALADNLAAIREHKNGGYVSDFFYFTAGPLRLRINHEAGPGDLMNQHFDGQGYVVFDPL